MIPETRKIPFEVDISRIIEVLAKQIYQSPLALLRENTQNAFDAILLRKHRGDSFVPSIEILLKPDEIRINDNGIGMSSDDLENHYWSAGSSSKNNPDSRAAGVVGTFGIGAMANFGIAGGLIVVTESAESGERTRCIAKRDTLSATEECIEFHTEASTGEPGTEVVAKILPENEIDIEKAKQYIRDFVAFLDIHVSVNGVVISQNPVNEAVSEITTSWQMSESGCTMGSNLKANVDLRCSHAGEVWIALSEIEYAGKTLPGKIVLRQNVNALRTFRSGFGLATTNVNSAYQFGGIADLLVLEPTAGREALSTTSMQLLQSVVSEVDDFVSEQLGVRPESDSNTNFMSWILRKNRYDLCSYLKIRVEPELPELILDEVKRKSKAAPLMFYAGADNSIISAHASDDSPLLVLATRNPRRKCQMQYLITFCQVEEISDQPKVLECKSSSDWSTAESGFAFRLTNILETDYFIKTNIEFGKISHNLPVLADQSSAPVNITLDPDGPTLRVILDLYNTDYPAFGSMSKDFVRNMVFPRIADLVPSSTRQGAEAFLKSIQKTRDVFEYEISDLESLTSIWGEYAEGHLTMSEAARRSSVIARKNIQIVDFSASRPIRDVLPDVIESEAIIQDTAELQETDEFEALPPIMRTDQSCDAKLLLIGNDEEPLKGYRCFLSISDRVREEKGEFFLQPHKTSVVWGGQKTMFIFQHHSGRFGLYYDLQTPDLVSQESGGGSYVTCTIVLQDRIFIPIPEVIQPSFIPGPEEKKRLEVRCDLLYIDTLNE